MLDMPSSQHDQWVAMLFQTLLKVLESLDWQQDAPDVFLVYAHDNTRRNEKADSDVAHQLIDWLRQLGANIYSDKTGSGNPPIPKTTPADTAKVHDILSSQLGLLPHNKLTPLVDRREYVILCGSALLREYFTSAYYPQLKQAYQTAQEQTSIFEAKIKLVEYVNTQVKEADFHHVLTELAFLQIRAEYGESQGMIPLLLNGEDKESFPSFIMESTTVRIQEAVWRESRCWNDKIFYKNQGLHIAFFKLLKRLWVGKGPDIVTLEEGVYQDCLKALQSREAPQSADEFASLIQKAIWKTKQRLINSQSRTLRILTHQEWMDKISDIVQTTLEEHLPKTGDETEKRLKEWYPSLTHRLAIQRVSGDSLPMERC